MRGIKGSERERNDGTSGGGLLSAAHKTLHLCTNGTLSSFAAFRIRQSQRCMSSCVQPEGIYNMSG